MRLRLVLPSLLLATASAVAISACSDEDPSSLTLPSGAEDGEDYAEPVGPGPDDGHDDGDPTSTPGTSTPAPAPAPSSSNDDKTPPAPTTPAPGTTIPHAPLLRAGLHPDASDRLRFVGITAAQITQTIGNAAASAGTHAADGTADGKPYSAATDISILGKTDAEVKVLIDKLAKLGFAPYYRKPGFDGWPSTEARHLHVVYAGCKMKLSLRNQMRDFFVGKNGLASHTTYTFYTWPLASVTTVKTLYLKYNPATG